MRAWLIRNKLPLAAFVLALVVYGVIAGPRLRRRSPDPHFGVQAAAWLKGRLDISPWPQGADDPAKIDEVVLDDGRVVLGRRLTTRQTFKVAGGDEIPVERVKETRRTLSYNSFPPFPSVVMLPQVLISGEWANDTGTCVFVAALVPAAFLVLLRRLREAKLSTRSTADELWLTATLAFGTVFFFTAVQGRVWFTAHVVGVFLAIAYVWACVDARHPLLAGLFLGLATATRTPMAFMAPLFLWALWKGAAELRVRRFLLFAAPLAVIGVVLAWFNYVRFHELGEFGHSYLAVRQQAQMETYGLFNFHYLGRNLSVALTLLPDFTRTAPYIRLSGHGLAIWFTSPVLLLLLWPKNREGWHRPLLATIGCVAVWSLLYQNSGWLQFGYRFSLDYMVLLVALLAIGGRPLTRFARALIVVGIAVNLFGALTFNRSGYYVRDTATYNCVVAH